MAMAVANGLPGPTAVKGKLTGGRHACYALPPGASSFDPMDLPVEYGEAKCLRMTEISKMKGQGLVCERNAKLIAVNLRWIAYAMKEGAVRIINQNGKDLFKVHNVTKERITDMAFNGTGACTDPWTTLLCLDEAHHVSIFLLESHGNIAGEQRDRKVVLVFLDEVPPPRRILGHPTDKRLFVTVHATNLGVWSLQLLEQHAGFAESPQVGIAVHGTDRLIAEASVQYTVPHMPETNGCEQVCDAAVSLDGRCLLALVAGTLFVWRLVSPAESQGQPELLKTFVIQAPSSAIHADDWQSLRILRSRVGGRKLGRGQEAEVVVVASATGCELLAYQFTPASSEPVGKLLQSISIASPSGGSDMDACIDVDHVEQATLGIAFRHISLVLVLPIHHSWPDGVCTPFQYAQRFASEEPADQLCIMSGKSYQTAGHALFMYRAHNFIREKDKLMGCNIVVSEVEDARLAVLEDPPAPEDLPAGDAAAGESAEGAAALAAAATVAADPGAGPPDAELAAPAGPPEAPAAAEEQARPVPNGTVAGEEVLAKLANCFFGQERGSAPEATAPPGSELPSEVANGAGEEPAAAPGDVEVEAGPPSTQYVVQDKPPAPKFDAPPEPTANGAGSPRGGEHEDSVPPPPNVDRPPELSAGAASAAEGEECEEGGAAVLADGAPAAGSAEEASAEIGSSSRRQQPGQESQSDRSELDWGYIKQIAASFVQGLHKRRNEMASRLLKELSEAMHTGALGATSEADAAILEQALAAVREARDAQTVCERNLQSATRKATDSWAEASAAAVATMLQKELSKISDGVAATLAQQLSQSRKFCEALARGVQKSGNVATKQALEALRPPRQLQETVGNALTEALQESLSPVFKSELRLHFEQELAPLIGQRTGEMMASFRDRMGKFLEGIASEHELAGQRLGRELAPIVAEELRQVEEIVAQNRPASNGEISDSQLDELTQTVMVEVVQPMQTRIQDLTAQVENLREEARRLEERWQTFQREQAAARLQPAHSEEAQARELEGLFQEGKVVDAFVKAMHLQADASRCDFLDRLCSLVPEGGLEDWLAGSGDGGPLNQQVKMLLMLSLARQLEGTGEGFALDDEVRAKKIEWINELWFAFDPADPTVKGHANTMLAQLSEALDNLQLGGFGSETTQQLRRLKKAVQQYAKILRDKL